MNVLAFRHVPFEHLGLIGSSLKTHGISWSYVDLFANPVPPDWDSADALIFLGGPMSANDDLPFIREELKIIERAVSASRPVLGICLGAQLIAKALGARVYRNRVKEIGWAPVCWRPEAREDPLFHDFHRPEVVFHWHGETFDLPGGAAWLASSEDCAHQAFRAGPAYGLQFHVEVTPEMISSWCVEAVNSGDMRELAAPIDPYANSYRLQQASALVFGRWAGMLPIVKTV